MLCLDAATLGEVVAACLAGYPLEACGLLVGTVTADRAVVSANRTGTNLAASSRVYTLDPRDLLRADREAEASGEVVVGVWHSHTHTDAYPSPTDIASAPDPSWWYVLVSLRDVEPMVRAYRIVDGRVEEDVLAVR